MNANRKSGGFVGYSLLVTLILPVLSFIIILSGGQRLAPVTGPSSETVPINQPPIGEPAVEPTALATGEAPVSDQTAQTTIQPTSVPTDQAPLVVPADRPDTSDEFRAIYGDQLYPSLDAIPADLLSWYLYWVQRVAQYYDVPEEDILAVHYAELMGNGFRPLETRRSSANAGGPGQIIPQTWNGWSCGRYQTVFFTNPADITRCGGLGTDFDGDGVANVDSLPDNLAATARHIKGDGISTALRANQTNHENVLREALSQYNSNSAYWQASLPTRRYADIGVAWMKSYRDLVPVYIAAYVQPA